MLTIRELCTQNVFTAYPDEALDDVLGHFGAMDVGRIPVVERRNPRRVLGILRRVDIVHSLSQAMADRQKIMHHMDRLQMEGVLRTELKETDIKRWTLPAVNA